MKFPLDLLHLDRYIYSVKLMWKDTYPMLMLAMQVFIMNPTHVFVSERWYSWYHTNLNLVMINSF